MANPDRDNPDLHILGEGVYDNLRTWRLIVTPERVEIAPLRTSWRLIVFSNLIFFPFFAAWAYFVVRYGDAIAPATAIAVAVGIWLLTSGLYTGITLWAFRDAQKKGSWLIIDRNEQTLQLPREAVTATLAQVDHLQTISTYRFGSDAWSSQSTILSELNIVLNENGSLRRYPLLRSIYEGDFDKLGQQIAKLDLLPVKRIRGNGDQIYQTWLTTEPSAAKSPTTC